MSSSGESTAIEALSANVVDTSFEDIDREVVETTKNRIIDIMGCAIGGANAPGNAALVDLVKNWGCGGKSTIWIHGVKGPAEMVAMANSVICRSFDFEEMGGSHQSGTTIPTAIAMAEATGASGRELLTALIAGNDVGYRIIRAFDFDFFQGFDGIGTIQVFPAAAIAGRLLGLNAYQLKNAFGIVLTETSGTIQDVWDGATTFKLPQGLAARSGIFAAEMAKGGWTGVNDALLARFGYYNLYTHGCTHPENLTKDLSKVYYADTSYKRFPCGGPNHIAIDAALRHLEEHKIIPGEITEVILRVNHHAMRNYYAKPFQIRDFPHGDAIFSFQYTLACALLRGHLNLEDFLEDAIRDPQVNALIGKIKVVELPEEMTKGTVRPAELTIRMKDGHEHYVFADIPTSPLLSKPMTREELKEKFMTQVAFSGTVSRDSAAKILGLVENLEELDNVKEIIGLLVM
jgi:2-methylcitrate dehydratase PrpD